jgi:uncharacterized RDD family membrane protein YckC
MTDQATLPSISTTAYAGFWLRFVAHIIDMFICTLLTAILLIFVFMLFMLVGYLVAASPERGSDLLNYSAVFLTSICGIIGTLAVLLSHLLYFSYFESSKLMATPGKLALRIIVTDLNGDRLSFARALGRTVAKGLSYLLFYIGFIMAAFTAKKQALHDILANCLVLRKLKT